MIISDHTQWMIERVTEELTLELDVSNDLYDGDTNKYPKLCGLLQAKTQFAVVMLRLLKEQFEKDIAANSESNDVLTNKGNDYV